MHGGLVMGKRINATDMLCLQMRGAIGDYNEANEGKAPHIRLREVHLVAALAEVVDSLPRNRKARKVAEEAIRLWESQTGTIQQGRNHDI